ncbi:hypothetical protein [Actinoplanes sp. NPDC049802]
MRPVIAGRLVPAHPNHLRRERGADGSQDFRIDRAAGDRSYAEVL